MATTHVTRVVKGPKVYWHIDPDTGAHYAAQPGDEIQVHPQQAVSKAKHLLDPNVAKAEKAAAEAVEESKAEVKDKSKSTSKPKGGGSSGSK